MVFFINEAFVLADELYFAILRINKKHHSSGDVKYHIALKGLLFSVIHLPQLTNF